MNREEADEVLGNCDTYEYGMASGYDTGVIDDLIDKIYDDFESRTCESCKYCYKYGNMKVYECTLLKYTDSYSEISYQEVDEDFGCNKWEAKDESE